MNAFQGMCLVCVLSSREWFVPRMPIKPAATLDLGKQSGLPALLREAMAHHNQGEIALAARCYQKILRIAPDHFDATHLLAVVNAQRGNNDRARALFARALDLHPDHAEVHFNKGTMEKAAGDLNAAVTDFGRAIGAAPDHAGALNNRSLAFQEMRLFDRSLLDSDRLVGLAPSDPVAWNNRGVLLHDMMRLDEALSCLNEALRLKPDYAEALNNRGNVLKERHQLDSAIADYDSASAINPDFAEAHFNKGIVRLLQGDYADGWRLWEWRWRQTRLSSPRRDFTAPLWLGDTDLAGKTILLHSEQGLGDTMQFIRYAPMVADLGASIVLEAPKVLHPLLRTVTGTGALVGKDEALPDFDLHCPLMSLPLAFGTTLDTVPAPGAYCSVSPDRVDGWAARLGPSTKPRVALAWRGNTDNVNDHNRSARLEDIWPLLSPDVEWLCLHHDLDASETEIAGPVGHLRTPLDGDTDLEDAAAICALSDLVVTVDTSFAHIAGALGKTSLVMLPFTPDWRWMMHRSDTPWYDGMTLFRQDESRDWGRVIKEVAAALEALPIRPPDS